jgi:deoxyribodipyrimidine photolyase-like uncharacterized protein
VRRSSDSASSFTTLYWAHLRRHEPALARTPPVALQVKNGVRLTDAQQQAMHSRAAAIRGGAK